MPTIDQLRMKITKLQTQADALIAKKMQSAVDQIRKIMLEHGLTTDDIEQKAKARREAKTANGSVAKAPLKTRRKAAGSLPGKSAPKYRHPKTGATWTGHGRAPAWIAQVKDRSKFLISNATRAADAADTTAKQARMPRKNAKSKPSTGSAVAKKTVAKKNAARTVKASSKSAPAKKAARKRSVKTADVSQKAI